MAEQQKLTHYRKAFNSPYLSSADLVGPTVLTIDKVVYDIDKTKRSKEYFNTAYFVEQFIRPGEVLKPMILNSGNTNIVKSFCQIDGEEGCYIEKWNNIAVTIYVLENVRQRDGSTGQGLRINPQQPVLKNPELTPNTDAWQRAIAAYKRDGNLDKVLAHMSISDANQALIVKEAGNVA